MTSCLFLRHIDAFCHSLLLRFRVILDAFIYNFVDIFFGVSRASPLSTHRWWLDLYASKKYQSRRKKQQQSRRSVQWNSTSAAPFPRLEGTSWAKIKTKREKPISFFIFNEIIELFCFSEEEVEEELLWRSIRQKICAKSILNFQTSNVFEIEEEPLVSTLIEF